MSVTEKQVQEALSVLQAEYYEEVRDMAKDLAKRMKEGDVTDFHNALHEDVDGCQRVIYTFKSQVGLICSDNSGAYADNFGSDGLVKDGELNWAGMMYAAMEQDIIEELDARGVDVDDEDSWKDIDLSEWSTE